MSVAAGVSDAAIAVRDKLRGKIGQTKVKRYWPGKAPEWADEPDDDLDLRTRRAALDQAFPCHDDADADAAAPAKDDRRLAETRGENREELRADHRRIRQAKVVSTAEEEGERREAEAAAEEEDEEAQEERRRRIRERQLLREREEDELLPQEEEEPWADEDEEEDSEYETESEDEGMGIAMVKPGLHSQIAV